MKKSPRLFTLPCINNTPQELFFLAYTDNLTQTYNRNMLEEFRKELDQEIGLRLYVTIIDIDDLKDINDRYGHAAGDQYIQQIATLISKKAGIVFRLGGDEFLLLDRQPIDVGDVRYISYGSVEREPKELLTSVMHRADLLMYEKKREKKIKSHERPYVPELGKELVYAAARNSNEKVGDYPE